MRSYSYCMVLFVMLFLSCHSGQSDAWKEPGISDGLAPRIVGIYNGHFEQGLMTLVINYFSDSIVSGYDLHKGLRRNVNGAVQQKGDKLELILKEPGNNPRDGIFYLTIDTASLAITGKWIPEDSTKVQSGSLDLKRWDKDTSNEYISGPWNGHLGRLSFNDNGTCELSYSGVDDSNDPGTTIWGNYKQKADTFFIEWEPNHHLPIQQMRLVKYPYEEGSGDNPGTPTSLRGSGVKFEENMAG